MTDKHSNNHPPPNVATGKQVETGNSLSKIQLDPDKYRSQISELNYTVEEENELLGIVWNIMSAAVDLGWGLDATQVVLSSIMSKSIADSNCIEHSSTFNQAAKIEQKGDHYDK